MVLTYYSSVLIAKKHIFKLYVIVKHLYNQHNLNAIIRIQTLLLLIVGFKNKINNLWYNIFKKIVFVGRKSIKINVLSGFTDLPHILNGVVKSAVK